MDKKNRSACFSFCNTEAKKTGSAQFSSSRIHAHMHRKKYVRTNDVRVLSTQYSGSAFSETRSAYSETRSAYSETRSAFSETRSAFSETCVSFKQSANPDASARPELPPLAPPGRQKTGRPGVFCRGHRKHRKHPKSRKSDLSKYLFSVFWGVFCVFCAPDRKHPADLFSVPRGKRGRQISLKETQSCLKETQVSLKETQVPTSREEYD